MKTKIAKQIPILFGRINETPGKGSKIVSPCIILSKWNELLAGKLNPVNSKVSLITDEEIQSIINESEKDQAMLRATLLEMLVDTASTKDKLSLFYEFFLSGYNEPEGLTNTHFAANVLPAETFHSVH